MSEVVVQVDDEGRIRTAYGPLEEALGWRADELLGMIGVDLVHPDDLAAFIRDAEDLSPSILRREVRLRRGDGTYRWLSVLLAPIVDSSGTIIGRISSIRDVDDDRRVRDQYRMVAELATDVVGRASVDGVFEWISPAVTTVLGWRPEEVIGRPVLEFIDPADLRSAGFGRPDDLGGRDISFDARVLAPNGGHRWMSVLLRPVRDERDRIVARVVGWRDIHREHVARAALAEREAQYRLLAENSSDVVVQVDNDGIVQWVSPSIAERFGWQPEELIGRTNDHLLHPDDRVRLQELRANAQQGVFHSTAFEARYMARDGRYVWLSVKARPIRDEFGNVVGRIASWRDVDEEHRVREQLREREERLRLLVENATDVVAYGDNSGVLRWVTDSVERVLGIPPEAVVGTSLLDLVHPDERDELDRRRTVLAEGRELRMEVRLRRGDGDYRWMSIVVRPLIDEDGNVVGRVGGWRDIDDERRVRDQLRESEERMRLIAENATDVVLQADREGTIEWISESVQRTLGRTAAEMVGRQIVDFVYPDDVPAQLQARDDINRGRDVRFEMRVVMVDGSTRWVSVVARPLFSATGKVIGRVAGWRNIDTERQIRDRLRDSEEQLRFLIDNVTDVVVQQVEGVPVFVSPAITRVLGWRPEDLLGKVATELWHPDDQARAAELRHEAMHGAGGRQVMRMLHKDGTYRWIEASARPAPAPDGRPGSVGLLRDVTARVEAEMALAEAQERDRLMAELSSDVFIIYAADQTIVWIIGATQQILGVPPESLLGTQGADLFVPDDRQYVPERVAAMDRGEMVAGFVRVLRPDGGAHWVDWRSRAVFDEHGEVRFYAASWRDAQAEVEFRERLTESEREAKEANLAKTGFLSRMSHELRTPLNAVLGFGQLLQMDDLPAGQAAAVEQILAGGRHLLELINEVLDIARIESGRMSMSPEAVMVADVISQSLDLVRPMAAEHQVQLPRVDLEGCSVLVRVDRQRTIQVLLNLLSNAIKYNRVGGAVRVSCRELDGDVVAIDIADDGRGIAPELLPRLFEPFDRLGAEATGVEGTGIGLALSRGLAEMMHGRIEVSSTVGVGSTFSLLLPRTEALTVPGAAHDVPVGVTAGHAGRVVLYVEDNPANAMLMRSIVSRRAGVVLREVSTGESALEWAFADPPDLVLLDLHLPDIPGEEVLRRLRMDPRTAAVPVVVVSADAASDVRGRLGTLGADAFIPKPVELVDVLSWIDDPLQGRGRVG